MRQENVLKFVRKVSEDPGLLAKLRPLAEDDMTGLLRVAAEAGFDFSAEDYMVATQAQSIAPEVELADEDLDRIAGGAIFAATMACPGIGPKIAPHNPDYNGVPPGYMGFFK